MNWDAIGAIGELVGSLAVLLTLIYLAIQVRHSRHLLEENRKIALSGVYSSRIDFRFRQYEIAIAELSDTFAKLASLETDDPEERFRSLNDEERQRLRQYHSMAVQGLDHSLFQGSLGLLDEMQFQNTKETIRRQYPEWLASNAVISPRVRDWYERDQNES